jgi:hypothetical protein
LDKAMGIAYKISYLCFLYGCVEFCCYYWWIILWFKIGLKILVVNLVSVILKTCQLFSNYVWNYCIFAAHCGFIWNKYGL